MSEIFLFLYIQNSSPMRRALYIILIACLAASCSRTGKSGHEGGGDFPASVLGEALDTMSTSSLEKWVDSHADDIHALNVLYGRYAMANEHEKLIRHAEPLLRKALEEGNDMLAVYAGTYIGQSFSMLFQPDSMYTYFDMIYDKARKLGLNFPMMVINNQMGVSKLTYSMNYSESLYYFYEALKYCDDSNPRNRLLLLWNIVNTYYMREDTEYLKSDPEGEEYALEIYTYGKENDDDYILYMGALACAYMYYVKGEYGTALEYVEQTVPLETYKSGINNSDALHGSILAALGRNDEAESYFRRSISLVSEDYSTLIEALLSYGEFLTSQGRYEEAASYYLKGIAITEEHSLYFYGHRLYDALSDAYAALGQDSLAFKYMKTYQTITDSVFNVEKERSFNNLRRDYETQKHRNEVQELDIRILKETKKKQALIFLTLIIAVAAASIIIWQHRRQLMYKRLVRNYDSCINNPSGSQDPNLKITSLQASGTRLDPEDKLSEIFMTAEHYMRDLEAFRDSELSIDSLAKKMGTNQAYLSKAVNTYAKSSFRDYVNTYRIRYAVRLLSDLNNDSPIKEIAARSGYNNLQSFYKNFRKETDVPPSRYRETIKKLKKEEKD